MKILKIHKTLLCLLVLLGHSVFSQNVLSLDQFLEQLRSNHPIAKQAQLQVDQANANILAAKGSFDPILQFDNSKKTLDGKNYYTYQNTELKYQTPYGISLKSGLEQSNGLFVNPEQTPGGLGYFGLELPLLKGLLIDNQRAALKQAVLYRNQSEQEQLSTLNDLYLDAIEAYIQWSGSFQNLEIIKQNLSNAESRYRLQRIAFKNGDRAAVDTLEAFTQVQNILMMQLEAQQAYNTSAIHISNFLWSTNSEPYLISPSVNPNVSVFNMLDVSDKTQQLLENLELTQPELKAYTFKLAGLDVERRLKFQYMLPQANLKYNVISGDSFRFNSEYSPYLNNNYKFGFDFKMPLFLREARGNYQKVNFKIKETNLAFDYKNWEIQNKIRNYGVEIKNLKDQINNAEAMVNNYQSLLRNEDLKLSQGESTLFLINSRENKLLESLLKLQNLKIKYLKSNYKQIWAAGRLLN
jgi:outer membrane protein TolC